jgi:hypothetical protein
MRDSRDTENRIKSCYKWNIKCLHQIDRGSLEIKLVHEPIKELVYNCFLINEFVLLMNSLNMIQINRGLLYVTVLNLCII